LDYRFRIKSYQQIQDEYFGEDAKSGAKNADKSKNKEIKSKSLTRLQGASNNDNLIDVLNRNVPGSSFSSGIPDQYRKENLN